MQATPKSDAGYTLSPARANCILGPEAMKKTLLMLVLWPLQGGAQDSMSLKDAVHLALEKNKSMAASVAAQKAAESRIAEARGGYLPKVNYSESWTRSDNPVFVFSSLLTQHQFGEQNFQVGPLNRPDFLNNFQSQVTADETLYDAGRTRHAVRAAELTKDLASEEGRRTQMEVIAGVIQSYHDSLLGVEQLNATNQAMRLAEAELDRAHRSGPRGCPPMPTCCLSACIWPPCVNNRSGARPISTCPVRP